MHNAAYVVRLKKLSIHSLSASFLVICCGDDILLNLSLAPKIYPTFKANPLVVGIFKTAVSNKQVSTCRLD